MTTLDEVLLLLFSSSLKRCGETSVCMCGEKGGGGGQERSKNQYIFTESPCVAGTQTGRKGAGQRKGKGFRVRKADGKERTEGKRFFYVSTRYLTT